MTELKKSQEALEIRENSLHAGLLEHEFRDKNPIGVLIFSPGQVSLMGGIPPEKSPLHSGFSRMRLLDVLARRLGNFYELGPAAPQMGHLSGAFSSTVFPQTGQT